MMPKRWKHNREAKWGKESNEPKERVERIDIQEPEMAQKMNELFDLIGKRLENNTTHKDRLKHILKVYAMLHEFQVHSGRVQKAIEHEVYEMGYIVHPYLDIHLEPVE